MLFLILFHALILQIYQFYFGAVTLSFEYIQNCVKEIILLFFTIKLTPLVQYLIIYNLLVILGFCDLQIIQIMSSLVERRLSLTQQKSLRESLQSIAVRFMLNLPIEQRTQKLRLPFHYQKAYYYYIDHELKELFPWEDPKKVDLMWFVGQINKVLSNYMKIMTAEQIKKILGKQRPTCGAIIINEKGNKVLVTESKNKFGFPKGAKDQDESSESAAARQVKEEVGLFIHTLIDSNRKVEYLHRGEAPVTFYIVTNFDENQPIIIQNNEIDNAFWMNVSDVSKYLFKFSQKCRNAWREYQSNIEVQSKLSMEQFLNIYRDRSTRKDKKETNINANPLLNFKLDHDRLFSVFKQITECQSP